MGELEIKDYRALLKYGDIKKICAITGLSPYKLKKGLETDDYETIQIVKTYFEKRLEVLKNAIYESNEA